MNEKQRRFCEEYVKCDSAAEAYRLAGYKATSAKAASNSASRLLENDGIRGKIEELRGKIEQKKIMDAKERRERLTEIAKSSKSPAVAIKAIDVLNKMDAVYVTKTELSGAGGGPLTFTWEDGHGK